MFFKKLFSRILEVGMLCVGLDTDLAKIPISLKKHLVNLQLHGKGEVSGDSKVGGVNIDDYIKSDAVLYEGVLFEFNRKIVDATYRYAACYKLNLAFYLAAGVAGLNALIKTVCYIQSVGVQVILDFKEADIGNSSAKYAEFAFDYIKADAVTVNPYLGYLDALEPFYKYTEKGIFVLCHTSNKGSVDVQEQKTINSTADAIHGELYKIVAQQAVSWGEQTGLVMGATFPTEIRTVRHIVGPDVFMLIPAIGKQKGALEESVKNSGNKGIVNVSRDTIYASSEEDFAEKAGERALWYQTEIVKFVKEEQVTL